MDVELPKFMRKRAATREGDGAKDSKAAKMVEEAERAAAGTSSGDRKPRRQAIVEQLMIILTRLCLANAKELAEVTGVLFRCLLLPLSHILATGSALTGQNPFLLEESGTANAKAILEM